MTALAVSGLEVAYGGVVAVRDVSFTVESGAVIFDNLAEGEVIDSPVLANLLTNPMWSSRILGKSGMGSSSGCPHDRTHVTTSS